MLACTTKHSLVNSPTGAACDGTVPPYTKLRIGLASETIKQYVWFISTVK